MPMALWQSWESLGWQQQPLVSVPIPASSLAACSSPVMPLRGQPSRASLAINNHRWFLQIPPGTWKGLDSLPGYCDIWSRSTDRLFLRL